MYDVCLFVNDATPSQGRETTAARPTSAVEIQLVRIGPNIETLPLSINLGMRQEIIDELDNTL